MKTDSFKRIYEENIDKYFFNLELFEDTKRKKQFWANNMQEAAKDARIVESIYMMELSNDMPKLYNRMIGDLARRHNLTNSIK